MSKQPKYTGEAVDDAVVVTMYFALPQGDLSFVLYRADDIYAGLDVHTPAVMSDLVTKSLHSWLRGIRTSVSRVFAGRSVPMVTVRATLPVAQIAHAVEVMVKLAGMALQEAA